MAEQTLAELQRRLQRLEDKDAITALLHRYCKFADTHQWEKYTSCFVPDAVVKFDDWDDVIGRNNICTLISSAEDRFQGQQHSLTNIDINLDGNMASGTCYLWFAAIMDTSKPREYHGFGGPYEFNFTRTNEGWKIASLKLNKIWAQNADTEGVFGG
ncbi:hypothetical protein CIB48_g3320 [Xylaria polymorpha]|nr:hypothetical protein CIB48_g3320 [Xylaria polymorpha]